MAELERCNSIASSLELCLPCTSRSICAVASSLAHQAHPGIPVGHPDSCGSCNSTTAEPIYLISSSMEVAWPIDVQQHGHWPVRDFWTLGSGHSIFCGWCNSRTAGLICYLSSSMELSWPIYVQLQDHWSSCTLSLFQQYWWVAQ